MSVYIDDVEDYLGDEEILMEFVNARDDNDNRNSHHHDRDENGCDDVDDGGDVVYDVE